MATERYTQAQVDNIIRQAEMQGDLGNSWIQNRRILATQPKCSCDPITHTCQQKYSSDKGWTEECLPKSVPVYRLSNGDGVESCVQTSCGDWTCADEAGCIHDTCGGCDITTCPPDPTEPDLTTAEGIALATLKFFEENECPTLDETIESAGGIANMYRPYYDEEGYNPNGWVQATASCNTIREVLVIIDGVTTINSFDVIDEYFGLRKANNYMPCVREGAYWVCGEGSHGFWANNGPEGVSTVKCSTVLETAHHEEITCVGGVTHTKITLIQFLHKRGSTFQASNHPGTGAVCVPAEIAPHPKCPPNRNPNRNWYEIDHGRIVQSPTTDEEE